MSAAKKLPADLPPLPPVPEGFDAWELLGWGYDSKGVLAGAPWAYFFKPLPATGWLNANRQYMPAEIDIRVSMASFVIRAIKRPAKRKQPKQDNADKIARALSMVAESRPRMAKLTREQRQELEAEARKAMSKPKHAKAVKAVLEKRSRDTGRGYHVHVDRFILPADKASVERMEIQGAVAIDALPKRATKGEIARAVFASIGITSTKGRQ